MKFFSLGSVFILILLIYGFYLAQFSIESGPSNFNIPTTSDFYDYKGVINAQSSLGEGSSNVNQIINSAKISNLDFIFISDTNVFIKHPNIDGYSGSLLVSSEPQYSYLDARFILFNLSKDLRPKSRSESDLLISRLLARNSKSSNDPLIAMVRSFYRGPSWQGELPKGLDMLEVFNPRSISSRAWEENKLSVSWSTFFFPFNYQYSFLRLFSEPLQEINAWDKLLLEEHVTGFGGADATARAVIAPGVNWKFPGYEKSFETITNHVVLTSELTGQFQSDREKIYTALAKGQMYFSMELLGQAKGFQFFAEDRDEKYPLGSKINFNKRLKLNIKLPFVPSCFYEIIIFKDGQKIMHLNEPSIRIPIQEKGIYRATVRLIPNFPLPDGKRWFTWIYTNPIYIE